MARRSLASELNRRLVRMGLGASNPQGPAPMLQAYLSTLFRGQREVLECTAPQVAVVGTRRGGKSTTTPAKLFEAAERNPGTVIYYVHPDGGKRAGETLFGPDINLEHIAEEYRLPYKVNLHEKKLTHRKNGTELRLRGADDMREARKFRGDKVSLVVLEEAQNFSPPVLKALIDSELGPALADVGGQLVVQGTVGEVCYGPWYEITRNEDAESLAQRRRGWRVFELSALDNPHMMRPELGYQAALTIATKLLPYSDKALEQLVEQLVRGGPQGRAQAEAMAAADPTLLREWFGRWVRDTGSLFYAFSTALNVYQPRQLPRGHVWYYVVGVDLGTGDAYAHHVWAFSPTCPELYEVESYSEAGLDSEDWRNLVRQVTKRWNPVGVVVDEGGLGKGVAQGWRDKYAMPVEPASKQHKAAAVATLNGEMRAGRAKLLSGPYEDKQRGKVSAGATAAEMAALRKDTKGPPDKAPREDPSQPNHACFVAGTLVRAEHGQVPVELVRPGMRVWTRHGLREVAKAAQSGVRPTWLLETEAGHIIEGTQDHPVWTSTGWKALGTLSNGDTLTSWGGAVHPGGLAELVEDRPWKLGPTGRAVPVFNLTVTEHHEYFAGGLLVSNCDASLYGFRKAWEYMGREDVTHALPPEPGTPEAKELERKQRMDRARERAAAQEREVQQARGLLGGDGLNPEEW